MFAVYFNQCYQWVSFMALKGLCDDFDLLPEDKKEDYQSDSPYADFITGYNTDSYADESIDLMTGIWECYVEDCEDEDKTPTWDECWETRIWENFDYQLLHTWLRVTNIHNTSDDNVKEFAKECDKCTMESVLGLC